MDWDVLSDQTFEELCYKILEKQGFYNLKWLGRGGGDRGRDILCVKDLVLFENVSIKNELNYLVQCKKYVARAPAPSDLQSTISWANVHKPDVLIIMVSNILSSDTHDWIVETEKTIKYRIVIFDDKNFEQFFESYGEIYDDFFKSDKSHYSKNKALKIDILNLLLDKELKNLSEISEKLGVDSERVEPIVKELDDEKIISNNEDENKKYYLNEDIDSFVKISEYLLSSDYKYAYLLSPYANDNIDVDLAKYVNDRFFLDLEQKELNQLHVLLAISPSSLYDALFYNVEFYKNAHDHRTEIKLPEEEAIKWSQSIVNRFFMTLLQKTLIDLQSPGSTPVLKDKDIRGIKIGIELKLASLENLIFGMDSISVIQLQKASGPIEAGQLVSATDPDLFIDSGTLSMNLGMLELAIINFNRAIEQVEDKEKLKVAWNNKGVSLMRMKKWGDAVYCFEKTLEIDPNLEMAKKNMKMSKENVNDEN